MKETLLLLRKKKKSPLLSCVIADKSLQKPQNARVRNKSQNTFKASLLCQFLTLSRPLHRIIADLVLQLKSIPQK